MDKTQLSVTRKIWLDAEKKLQEHGYSRITIDILDNILPEWRTVVKLEIDSPEQQINYVVHEAIEVEEVYKKIGKWMEPRQAGELGLVNMMEVHQVADKIASHELTKKEYREKQIEDAVWWIEKNYKGKKVQLNPVAMLNERNRGITQVPEDIFEEALRIAETKFNLKIDWQRYEQYRRVKHPKSALYRGKVQ